MPKQTSLEEQAIGGQPVGKLLLKLPSVFRALERMEQRMEQKIAEMEHEVRYTSQNVAGFRTRIEQLEHLMQQLQEQGQ